MRPLSELRTNLARAEVCVERAAGVRIDDSRQIVQTPGRRHTRPQMRIVVRTLGVRTQFLAATYLALGAQRADSSAVISLTADLASPNSIEVFGSKYNSFSMPAKPGFMERLITITERESATSRIGMP
jgi:hypothetical protein